MNSGGYDSTTGNTNFQATDEYGNKRSDVYTEESEYYGDTIDIRKKENILRIGFININSIPSNDHPKNRSILQSIRIFGIDILGITEPNRCWHLLREKDRWREMTSSWWETSKNSIAYNTKDISPQSFQPGGTIVHTINKPAHRIISTGKDDTGLGRWTWTRFRGKHDVTLRVICAYRPCKPSTAGPNTAYSQQQRYYDLQGHEAICPRDIVLTDLSEQIKKWKEIDKDQIVLLMDCNEDVTGSKLRTWAQRLQLHEAITSKHKAPFQPTYHRGSKSIDGIFISSSIQTLNCGYLPFGAFPSDHRLLWMDITYDNAFGYNMPRAIIPAARKLNSAIPKVRKKWISLYERFIKERKAHIRLFNLESQVLNRAMTTDEEKEYENIMNIRHDGIIYADKRCRKLAMGGVAFSKEYKEATNNIELWKAAKTKKLGAVYSQGKFRRLIQRSQISINPLSLSLHQIQEREYLAFKHYYSIKKQDKALRISFLEQKAEEISKDVQLESGNVYSQLIRIERQRTAARNIKYTLGKIHGGGVTKVVIINNGERQTITTKAGIERECMKENDKKFRQTHSTPCMREPLRSLLGPIGTTTACDEILNGTFQPPPGTPQYTRELFVELQQITSHFHPPISHISTAMFKEGWKKMKEKTSAGISGLHFGHLRACTHSEILSNFEASLSSIPYHTGYSPQKWQYGITVMIQKKNLDDLITGLRTLVLTEADFNFNNKILGKMTLEHAEKYNLIAKEQYGSRKNKRAIDHAIHKRLTYDIIRMTRRPAALFASDAKSCFDRIIHSVAMLAYRRLGVPSPSVECMFKTIQNMKHHVRTNFGDSVFTMSRDGSLIPYQGSLQGNGASTTSWVVISTPLLNMLRRAGNGGFFQSPISKRSSHLVGMAYVDDTDVISLDMRDHTISTQDVMESMQDAINRWEGGLKATGGAIRPDKSWVYPIDFSFNNQGKWTYKTTNEINFDFRVKDCNEEWHSLPQYDPHIGKETLGVYLAVDGNNDDMKEVLRKKAEAWNEMIKTGHLKKTDAWLALNSTIMMSLKYPLPALTLSRAECKYIVAPVMDAGLPASAICRKFPHKVLYGASDENGLGETDLYIEQGASQLSYLKEYLHTDSVPGDLMRILIEQSKVEIGVGGNLFTLDYALFSPLLTSSWIKHVWKFCIENNIVFHDNVTTNLQLRRESDLYLMEVIAHSGRFSAGELKTINRCRLHMRVTTLSDITSGNGDAYSALAYRCIRDGSRPHYYNWPRQPRPNKLSIAVWRKALRLCFPRQDNIMEYKIGKWITPSTTWTWFYNSTSHKLYQRYGHLWKIWHRAHRRGRLGQSPKFKYFSNGIMLPPNSSRATIIRDSNDNTVRLTGWSGESDALDTSDGEPLSYYSGWILNDITESPQSLQHIVTSIRDNSMRIVSDGSYLSAESTGTAAWYIEDGSQRHRISGRVQTPGDSEVQCAHRSELMGLLGAITHVNNICSRFQITDGYAKIACDGEGAIKAIILPYEIIKTTRKHFDLLASIRHSLVSSPLRWFFYHIDGHQDDIKAFSELDRWAQLNCMADEQAKLKLTQVLHASLPRMTAHLHFPHEPTNLLWRNKHYQTIKISSCLTSTLSRHIARETVRSYWRYKRKFPLHLESQVDWRVLHRSHKGYPAHRKKWLSKWVSGFCGVGSVLLLYRHQLHSKCPRCNEDNEKVDHVLQCPHPSALELWTSEIERLREWMMQNDAPPSFANSICDSLLAWQASRQYPPNDYAEENTRNATQEQDRFGWKSFMDGFFTKKWRLALRAHFLYIQSQKSYILWMSKLQRKLWEIAWKMWDHRNQFLHSDGKTIHQHDIRSLDDELSAEFLSGRGQLPAQYSRLYRGDLRTRLKDTFSAKRMWLTSVWTAQDKYEVGDRDRNPDVQHYINTWRKKIYIVPSEAEEEGTGM